MKKRIVFVCIHNSCRSQMAEAWTRHLAGDKMEIYSAGTQNYPEIKPLAIAVMEDIGIDMSLQYPKTIEDIPQPVDILITMGCGVECPYVRANYREDWGLEDPSGKSISAFKDTRDQIGEKVRELLMRIEEGVL